MSLTIRLLTLAGIALPGLVLRAENTEASASEKAPTLTLEERCARMDTDQDGSLSFAEYGGAELEKYAARAGDSEEAVARIAAKRENLQKHFAAKDTDGNGSLSMEEFAAGLRKANKAPKPPKPGGE